MEKFFFYCNSQRQKATAPKTKTFYTFEKFKPAQVNIYDWLYFFSRYDEFTQCDEKGAPIVPPYEPSEVVAYIKSLEKEQKAKAEEKKRAIAESNKNQLIKNAEVNARNKSQIFEAEKKAKLKEKKAKLAAEAMAAKAKIANARSEQLAESLDAGMEVKPAKVEKANNDLARKIEEKRKEIAQMRGESKPEESKEDKKEIDLSGAFKKVNSSGIHEIKEEVK